MNDDCSRGCPVPELLPSRSMRGAPKARGCESTAVQSIIALSPSFGTVLLAMHLNNDVPHRNIHVPRFEVKVLTQSGLTTKLGKA